MSTVLSQYEVALKRSNSNACIANVCNALVDQHGRELTPSGHTEIHRPSAAGGYIPDGTSYGYGVYDAVQYSTSRSLKPYFATDSRVTLNSWSRLRALSLARWAYSNVDFVRGAVDLMARLTVGTGFACRSISRNRGWAALADAYVESKFRNIGFANGESMDELLLHDSRGVDVDGDIGYVMTEDENGQPKLQMMEAHRIKKGDASDPNCVDGVWFDNFARRTDYNVLLPGDGDRTRRIPIQSFIYLAERNRADEPRSMTNLITALNPLQNLYEVLAFEMASVKKNSEIGLTVETATPDNPPLGPGYDIFMEDAKPAQGNQPAQPAKYYTREQVYGGGGKIAVLNKGEKLMAHDHERPGPGIEGWSKFIIRGIAVGFGVPFEVLWDPESIGGANTRLITALLRARLEQRRAGIVFPKLRRARFWVLARGIMRGEIPYDPDFTKVDFQPKFSDLTVDAGRESRERRANVVQGLDTFTDYYTEDGKDYTQKLAVRETEIGAQCEAAQRICEKYPEISFSSALARIAMLTPNANEAALKQTEAEQDTPPAAAKKKTA